MTDLPTHLSIDATLRVKILDACGMTCTFCHNEGTPVAADNRNLLAGQYLTAGSSGRMSIYADTNGASFLPATMLPDMAFTEAITELADRLRLSEMHLTGGEPTLHPRLSEIVGMATRAGYSVRMTSNGENGAKAIPGAAAAGLEKVNFSIFGTTPEELLQVQHQRFKDELKAKRKIDALKASIAACVQHGVRADANVVVVDETHVERVHRLLEEYAPELSVRLLNSLADGQRSLDAIARVLDELGAVPEARYLTAGVSGCRTSYRLPSGRRIFVKEIRMVQLPVTCASCQFREEGCEEGFYGTRLYKARDGRWMVGVCIQRMDLCQPLPEFLASELPGEITGLRTTEHAQLAGV